MVQQFAAKWHNKSQPYYTINHSQMAQKSQNIFGYVDSFSYFCSRNQEDKT